MLNNNHKVFISLLCLQMYLVIFPEGTRYNPELKNVITDSQAFAAKEGTGVRAIHYLCTHLQKRNAQRYLDRYVQYIGSFLFNFRKTKKIAIQTG